jgi:predicted transcriptional regulator
MNKVLILSVRPEHAINILNGKKTLELRKSVPKGFKGGVYVYVTKAIKDYKKSYYYQPKGKEEIFRLHGNIPARFWFDEFTYLKYGRWVNHEVGDWNYRGYYDCNLNAFNKLCLTEEEINDYGNGKDLYAWHIKNLDIFDKPMELREFEKEEYAVMPNGIWPCYQPITKAPKSYMYAWVKEE